MRVDHDDDAARVRRACKACSMLGRARPRVEVPMTLSLASPEATAATPDTFTDVRRRAHLIVSSAHGVVEVQLDGARFVGVLDAPGSLVGVGEALPLKLLCRADNAYPYVVEDPQDLVVRVLSIDDAAVIGERQLLAPGLGLTVAVTSPRHAHPHTLAPPVSMQALQSLPTVVGHCLDDALANMLAEQLEPDPHRRDAHDLHDAHDAHDAHDDDDDPDDPDVITGSLRRLPLAELVQAMSLARKTAAIHLRVPGGVGVVYLDDGEVACAQLDDDPRRAVARGAPAFARLLACDRGSFRVSFEREWHERNVHCSTQALLLDGLRLLDEARRPSHAHEPPCSDEPPRAHEVPSDDPSDEPPVCDDADAFVELEEVPVRPAMRPSSSSAAMFNVVLAAPRSSIR
jgi:hypothetical protein